MDSREYSAKGEDAGIFTEPLFVPIKPEPDFEGTSEENVAEENFETTGNVEDMWSGECEIKKDMDDADASVAFSFVSIKTEPNFEETLEETIVEKTFEGSEYAENTLKGEESDSIEEVVDVCSLGRDKNVLSREMHQRARSECGAMYFSSEIVSPSTQSSSVEVMGLHYEKHFTQDSCSSEQSTTLTGISKSLKSFAVSSNPTADDRMSQERSCYASVSEGLEGEAVQGVLQKPLSSNNKKSDHTVHMHSNESLFECSECGKATKKKNDLKKHMCIHAKERPFKCFECGKTFKRSAILSAHKRTHSGERPFKCSKCGKAFKRNGELTLHMRKHTGEKPYKCNQCGKAFLSSTALASHMVSHSAETPFRCNHCEKAFKRRDELTSHLRTHTGEKPFKCDQCGKSFTRSVRVTEHMRTHTGERPYVCTQCGQSYRTSSNLNSHMRHMHP